MLSFFPFAPRVPVSSLFFDPLLFPPLLCSLACLLSSHSISLNSYSRGDLMSHSERARAEGERETGKTECIPLCQAQCVTSLSLSLSRELSLESRGNSRSISLQRKCQSCESRGSNSGTRRLQEKAFIFIHDVTFSHTLDSLFSPSSLHHLIRRSGVHVSPTDSCCCC